MGWNTRIVRPDFVPARWDLPTRVPEFMTLYEDIDGQFGAITISETRGAPVMSATAIVYDNDKWFSVFVQSRTQVLTPERDLNGFASWVHFNALGLVHLLGKGTHAGVWWGKGINSGYGLDHNHFSLYNSARWGDIPLSVPGLLVFDPLYIGAYSVEVMEQQMRLLHAFGSTYNEEYGPKGILVFNHGTEKYEYYYSV